MRFFLLAAFALATLVSTTAAMADDWVATKLRGPVLVLIDGDWAKLKRGDVVPDDRVIRTLRGGRVTFQRGAESIDLGGNTQVQIFDRSGKKFTTVKQYFGSVGIEAEVQNVQHFGVQTPHLAAVVKGTRFVVVSDKRGAKVEVKRGHVAVEDRDTHQSTLVAAGQAASSGEGTPLVVSGRGDLPVVYGANGKPVVEAGTGKGRGKQDGVKAAAAEARAAALAAGATPKQAEKAAREAAKEAKEEAREAAKEAKDAAKEAKSEAREAAKEAKEAAKEAKSEAKSERSSSNSSSGSDNSGSGTSGSGNSGSGNSGSGNSGNGNSGSENSGNGNSGNGNSGHGKKDKD